jgi:DNA-directed RNA polymerase specialized sigma24 family protein
MPIENLEGDWNRELRSPVLLARFGVWREAEPALSRFIDAAALVRFMRGPAARVEKDQVLCALLAWAKQEPIGARVVFAAIQPGLLNMASRLARNTVEPEELWSVIFYAAWEGIRGYPVKRRTRRVAANLLLDTMHRTVVELGRESEWRALRDDLDHERLAPEEVDGDVDALLDDAVHAGAISGEEAEVIASRIDGVALADLARLEGVSYNTMKLRRQRAERRLLMFFGYRPVPRGHQKRPFPIARVNGVGHGPVG